MVTLTNCGLAREPTEFRVPLITYFSRGWSVFQGKMTAPDPLHSKTPFGFSRVRRFCRIQIRTLLKLRAASRSQSPPSETSSRTTSSRKTSAGRMSRTAKGAAERVEEGFLVMCSTWWSGGLENLSPGGSTLGRTNRYKKTRLVVSKHF